jgi:nucleoid DNA-binding protein
MTLTKRELVMNITDAINQEQEKRSKEEEQQKSLAQHRPGKKKQEHHPLGQHQVFDVVQRTLDGIAAALAKGDKVELRNFGVFEVKVRKARTGRNPNAPKTEVPIPERSVVKFKAGKEMRIEVLKLPTQPIAKSPGQSS